MDNDFEYQHARRRGVSFRLAVSLMLALGGVVGCDSEKTSPNETTPDAGDGDGGDGDHNHDHDAGLDAGETDASDQDAGDRDASEDPTPTLTQVHSGVVTGIEDLRGLTYAANGKIYASGFVTLDGDKHVAVARFSADGAPDDTFGTNGVASYNVIAAADDSVAASKGAENSHGVVELKNGDLVVQVNYNDGNGGQNVGLLKFDNKGVRNTTFGLVRVDFGWNEENTTDHWTGAAPPADNSWGIALDKSAGEKIVVFGEGPAAHGALDADDAQRIDFDRFIVRVSASDGSLDTSFSDDGVYSVDVDHAGLNDSARRGSVEPDGTIVSAGYTNFGAKENNHVTLIRLSANGTPDTAFGFGAPNTPEVTKFNPYKGKADDAMSESYAAVRQSTGRYVTTGYGKSYLEAESKDNDLVSFGLKDGALDATYGDQGALAVQSELDPSAGQGGRPFRENGRDLILLPGDRTLHAGCYDGFATLFLFTNDGALDTSFGTNGIRQYAHPVPFFKVALSPDGQRVAASTESTSETKAFLTILEVSSN